MFFFFIIAAIVATFLIIGYNQKKRALSNWDAVAKSLGLRFFNGGMMMPSSMTGKINGHGVSVRTATRGSGKNKHTVTEYVVRYKVRLPFKFTLTRQHFLHSFGKMFGMQDIEVGDKSFDDSVLVKGKDEAEIINFLTAPRRKHIKTALRAFTNIKISDSGIEVVTQGMEISKEKLRSTINTLCAMAEVIVPARQEDHPVERVRKAREAGDVANAMEIIAAANGLDDDELLELAKMEGELRYLGGESEKASEIFDELSKKLEDDEHSKRWRELAEESAPPPLPVETKAQTPEIESPAAEAEAPSQQDARAPTNAEKDSSPTQENDGETTEMVSMDNFRDEVFAPNMGSFDSTKLFDSKFKGEKVAWKGKLISAASFSFDFVFKNGGGVKATFEVFEVKSAYSSTKAKAIVRYPDDKLEELKGKIGEELEFSGKLVGLDGLTKNIFIA